jgi:hypothetical protein
MFRPGIGIGSHVRRTGRILAKGTTLLVGCVLLARCGASAPTITKPPEVVRSHIYPLPLDNVLAQTLALMREKGWMVKRAGNALLTNWQGAGSGLVSYRIYGQTVGAGLCTIRVERLVATPASGYTFMGPGDIRETDSRVSGHNASLNPAYVPSDTSKFQVDAVNDAAVGTTPPAGMVLTQQRRDADLELELQQQIDPTQMVALGDAGTQAGTVAQRAPVDAGPFLAAQVEPGATRADPGQPTQKRQLAELAAIWDGTFTFKGSVVGSFTGEVTVAVDGPSVELDDFCPDKGGTLTATGADDSAMWVGSLPCTAIQIQGCSNARLIYSFARATLSDATLTIVAAGIVETHAGCTSTGEAGGAFSTTFVARKADYIHIAVTRVKRRTSCLWPNDWEDLNSNGSMAMPDAPSDGPAYLGIIRANGSRLSDIQRLLRHCNQVVMLHGAPVLMKLAVTRPPHQ